MTQSIVTPHHPLPTALTNSLSVLNKNRLQLSGAPGLALPLEKQKHQAELSTGSYSRRSQ
jgi:hypothetical protein